MSSFVLIGDSQAVGLQPTIVELLQHRGFAFLGAATHEGWSTARMAASDEIPALARARPDLVLIVLGGNDSATVASLPEKIADLVAPFRARGAYVVWVGPAATSVAWLAERKAGVMRVQRDVAARIGFEWLDGWAMTADLEHGRDGVHFPRTQLDRWARRLDAALFARGRMSAWTWVGAGISAAMFGWLIWMAR